MAEATAEATATAKPSKTPAEKYEARKTLLQLLLIALVFVGVLYLGFHLATGVVIFVLWIIGRMTGVA